MKIRARLKHVAGGIADSFISRNNDLFGFWAPGLMYQEVAGAPRLIVVDLLTEHSDPPMPNCESVARNYAAFMRLALTRNGLRSDALSQASINVQFNAPVIAAVPSCWSGDPFAIKVILRGYEREGTAIRSSRCLPFKDGQFSGRRG